MPEAPKTLHFGAICEQNKNLHFIQTFLLKIVDIYKGVWYHIRACEMGLGITLSSHMINDMR